MPPSAEKGGSSARISLAQSFLWGQEEHRRVESAPIAPLAPEVPVLGTADEVPAASGPAVSQALVTGPLPPTTAPPLLGSSAPAAVLERALSEMTQL